MGEIELLALYWTVSGPVDVHYGREWSLFAWRDRCEQAARAGGDPENELFSGTE
jgi:hypothetical protein